MHTVKARSGAQTWEHEQLIVQRHLMLLATGIHELAGDVATLGPAGYEQVAGPAGPTLAERLEDLLLALEEVSAKCSVVRRREIERQMTALRLDAPEAPPLRLHLGAGGHGLAGWVNIDVYPAEFVLNVNRGLPFRDRSVDDVFLSHILEHMYYPTEALAVMREILRVLVPGGVVRIVVPDIEKCIAAYASGQDQFFADRCRTRTWWPRDATRLESFLTYAGASAHPAQFLDSHKFGYGFETVRKLLTPAGFPAVERSGYMASRHEPLRVDDASSVAGALSGDVPYSLFVEATAEQR